MTVEEVLSQETLKATLARAPEFKARAKACHDPAIELADWLIKKGFTPESGTDLLLYLVGYVGKIKGFDLNVLDMLGMYAAGRTDALMDKTLFEKEPS